jgi:hypothetical protein
MQNQRDYGKYEQQVNEPACDMEHNETAEPSEQKNHKQYGPDAHCVS